MASLKAFRRWVDRLGHRLQLWFYRSLVVVLPLSLVAAVGVGLYAALLVDAGTLFAGLPVAPWVDAWIGATVGGMSPLLQTILMGIVSLVGIQALLLIATSME